jgi:hypothetical protein
MRIPRFPKTLCKLIAYFLEVRRKMIVSIVPIIDQYHIRVLFLVRKVSLVQKICVLCRIVCV